MNYRNICGIFATISFIAAILLGLAGSDDMGSRMNLVYIWLLGVSFIVISINMTVNEIHKKLNKGDAEGNQKRAE